MPSLKWLGEPRLHVKPQIREAKQKINVRSFAQATESFHGVVFSWLSSLAKPMKVATRS